MPIIYPAEQLKRFREELERRKKDRGNIWMALKSIPIKREKLQRALANLEADEKFEMGKQEENERQVRFLEKTLIESTEISSKNDKLVKLKKQVARMQREIIEEERLQR